MLRVIRVLRARRLQGALAEQGRFYEQSLTSEAMRAWQLKGWNALWSEISANVPFYRSLLREGAPTKFSSWEQFRERMPIIDRALVQARGGEMADSRRPPDFFRTTGGSTSQPVRLPAWKSELLFANEDVWFGRSWFGIEPSDRLFLIWGHSHQLGRGWRGKLNALRRELKDALLGYHRCSAYDLSDPALKAAGEELVKFRPSWIVAYAVALDRFARANSHRAQEFAALKLKAAIATAEGFPRPDSAAQIEKVLHCAVPMEYGSVETGPMAQQAPDGKFHIFWRHWMIDGSPSTQVPGGWEIFVTSLYPRCFPLVRYRIGDLISADPNAPAFDQTFQRVIGRCNDCIELPDGGLAHSEAFTHAIKECAFVTNFQVVQQTDGAIRFRYVPAANQRIDEAEIRRRLGLIHPALQDVELASVSALPQTIAGKTRTILKEDSRDGG